MKEIETEIETETRRVRCQVYSRVVGYLRPVSSWNIAKKVEFKERQTYKVNHLELEEDTQPQ